MGEGVVGLGVSGGGSEYGDEGGIGREELEEEGAVDVGPGYFLALLGDLEEGVLEEVGVDGEEFREKALAGFVAAFAGEDEVVFVARDGFEISAAAGEIVFEGVEG